MKDFEEALQEDKEDIENEWVYTPNLDPETTNFELMESLKLSSVLTTGLKEKWMSFVQKAIEEKVPYTPGALIFSETFEKYPAGLDLGSLEIKDTQDNHELQGNEITFEVVPFPVNDGFFYGGHLYFSVVRENGKWKLDRTSYPVS